MSNSEHGHDGHRQRMYAKFIKYGPDIFEDHEILEMILFSSIPRANTNNIAHDLLQRFGSLRGVIDASIDELVSVKNVGEKSAANIKLMAALFSRSASTLNDKRRKFKTIDELVEYLQSLYIGESKEVVYMLLFNNSMRLITAERISEGSVSTARIDCNLAVKCAKSYNAAYVVFAHNHPGGKAKISDDDMSTTQRIAYIFSNFGIRFIDHFIIAEDSYCAIFEDNKKKCTIPLECGWSNLTIKSAEEGLLDPEDMYVEI